VCKRHALRTLRAASPGAHLVHIGNGRVSDTCGALAADTAFAKDSLADELAMRGAPFMRFATLLDVVREIDAIYARLPR
jgi:2-hydroxy-3-keto-5-methylthiopentenyl-1-phosphate phosphatase